MALEETWHSFAGERLQAIMVWSFLAVESGKWPDTDHNGHPWSCSDGYRFARAGTEDLENPRIFETPHVTRAGGLSALKTLGKPADVLLDTKHRIFAA